MNSVPRSRLVTDTKRVAEFCAKLLETEGWANHTAIGLERHGEIIAGVVYENYTGPNIFAHIAGIPGRRWMTRTFLHAIFHYAYVQIGVKRITAPVEESNLAALRLTTHFGFRDEAVLRGAMPSGDLRLRVLWREHCRFLGAPYCNVGSRYEPDAL